MAPSTLQKPRRAHKYKAAPNSARILDIWRMAEVSEISSGMEWYDDAHRLALTLDPAQPRQAAGVIAALSPLTDWGTNVNLAVRAYSEGSASGTFGANCVKADAIMAGTDPHDVIPLTSKKVRAFFDIIADPAHADAVCIDRHAFDVAQGRVTNDETRAVLKNKGVYESFADAYRRAARVISEETGVQVTPAQVQAVTWVTWRRLKGITD